MARPTESDPPRQWVRFSGIGGAVGAVLWTATPWLRALALGSRPYVATGFDAVTLAGWLLMGAGLVGFRSVFRHRYGRIGRIGVGCLATGTVVLAALAVRRVVIFVGAGFRAVPAVGEDPAGLVLSLGAVLGLGLVVVGAGLVGAALWRLGPPARPVAGLLVAGAVVPLLAVALRLLSLRPPAVGTLLVRTTLTLVPLGLGWAALGWLVWITPSGASGPR